MASRSRGSILIQLIGFLVIVLASIVKSSRVTIPRVCTDLYDTTSLNRSSFPTGFLFGTASAAYQYEGAASEDGRGPSIWDTYVHKYPGKVKDGSNGDVAVDSYHRYKEDVGIMKEMGLDAYRFSISWSRVLPNGKISGGVNKKGIEYYNNLINELLANDIKPFVTLFHWDLPQTLEDEYGGFLSPQIVKHFQDYAGLCYKEFGDRVKHWITLNEPLAYSVAGYATGDLAPGRCSDSLKRNCTGGDSGVEPYLVTHNQLLAHAAAVKLYKEKYQTFQKGLIGVTLVSLGVVPFSESKKDKEAAVKVLDFTLGWFMDPMSNGDYPYSMRSIVGNRLPKFSKEQSKLLKGSYDFIGLNYYFSKYVSDAPQLAVSNASYLTDFPASMSGSNSLITTMKMSVMEFPLGQRLLHSIFIRKALEMFCSIRRKKYHNPLIYITENGVNEFNDPNLSLEDALLDNQRVDYHFRHLYYLREAIKDGVNVKGYFAWSLLDNFEWTMGYTVRFGINFVDYNDGLKRYPKLSAYWFKNFLKK